MIRKYPIRTIAVAILLGFVLHWPSSQSICQAQEASGETSDAGEKIRAVINAYEAAFNKRDVETLKSHWSATGTFDRDTEDRTVTGSEAIAAEFAAMFDQDAAPTELDLQTDPIEMLSSNVALERGTATVLVGERRVESHYQTVFVRHGDKWLIDRVSEDAPFLLPRRKIISNHWDFLSVSGLTRQVIRRSSINATGRKIAVS